MKAFLEQMDTFFDPKAVAVIGASRRTMKAGHVIFKNFVINSQRNLFKGKLYPVNPTEKTIQGFKCYPSILDINDDIDLAVIVVPANFVPGVMHELAEKKVKAAAIITSGFSEIGNHELEQEVADIAKKAGIRVLGPNCLGVYDSSTGVDMLFLPETKTLGTGDEVIATPRPRPGPIAVVTQSGAFGAAALDYLAGKQMGVSKFVSFGNKADVTASEMLKYLLYDEKTRVMLMYAESIDKGREFMDVARTVTCKKPIIALKVGRSVAGARAAASHTGSIAGSDEIYSSAFKQVGVLRANDLEEFFDMGKALAFQAPIAGKNVAIITDAGGPGIMCVDECIAQGLNVDRFSEETLAKFEKLKTDGKIPRFATNYNPVDLTGSVTSEMFEEGIKILFEDPNIDGIIVLGLHHLPALQDDFVDRVYELSKKYKKSLVACDIGETEMALHIRSKFDKLGIPAYLSPEDAARAMAALSRYGTYLKKTGCFDNYVEEFLKRKNLFETRKENWSKKA
ncbi:MAG: CoA-binding protein [Candidatus Bathyarchaeota archaeon]|nr:CoA-binding protein [Candidatus Bathyarchaeum tardum]WGM89514.1 MAG: CoA-binding protein [Candidatus Bathyarchaeum tardum]WNZ28215.1 MAG: CoA-binding protein [Candidatus Bathyarchaeota archaeon]